MEMKELYLAQLEREMVGSRKALERVPGGKPDWKPHPKSMALGYLASVASGADSSIAIGINATVGVHSFSIAIGGAATTTASHQLVIGGSLRWIGDIDSEVLDARTVVYRRLGGPNVEPAIDLPRIRTDDHCTALLGEAKRARGFSCGRRTTDDANATSVRIGDRAHPR